MQNRQIELLAPAGDKEAFLAAIAAGANAVYFGLEHFSARTRAKNITIEQAKELLPLAKSCGVKTYLTLNTLLLQNEIEHAVRLAQTAADFGLDAVIVQDLGLFYALKQALPHLEFHASTQMTSHNLEQCKFLADLGFKQINLSRELSLSELKPLCEYLHGRGIVPEIFVHGAFCISFSGQCYFSGTLYGEAGNRGSCVQPCRRCYKLAENFPDSNNLKISAAAPLAQTEAGGKNAQKNIKSEILPFYLKDNNAFALAENLAELAPVSLKIEGRIKNAEYVWSLCSAWRQQLDNLGKKAPLKTHPAIEGAINRGYSDDYLRGNINSQMFATGEKDLSLVFAGNIESFFAKEQLLTVKTAAPKGNLIADGARILIKEKNGDFVANAQIEKIEKAEKPQTIRARIKITGKLAKKIAPNQQIFANTSVISPQKLARIIAGVGAKNAQNTAPLQNSQLSSIYISLYGKQGEPLKGVFKSSFGESVQFTDEALQKASGAGLNAQTAGEKLGKLGGTGFSLAQINCDNLQNGLYISPSSLNAIRRAAVEELTAMKQTLKSAKKSGSLQNAAQIEAEKRPAAHNSFQLPQKAELAFLCSQIETAQQLLAQKYCAILEIPLVISPQIEEFVKNSQVIPYFGAVLINEHLGNAQKLVKVLAQKKQDNAFTNGNLQNQPHLAPDLICGNIGLAQYAAKLGLKCLLAGNLNIANACSAALLCQNKNIFGFIPSLEIAPAEIANLKNAAAENAQIWYPLFYANLLMQSRQCLVKKATICTKTTCDANCIASCCKTAALTGVQGEELLAKKRPGFYSALYQQGITYYGENFAATGSFVNRYLVDLRFLPQPDDILPGKIAQNCEKLLHILIEENAEKNYQQKTGQNDKIAAVLKELQPDLGKIIKPKYYFTPCGDAKN